MKKRVQVLELRFLVKDDRYIKDLYTFPQNLLCLGGGGSDVPSLHSCPYKTGFTYLKVLHFQHIGVTGEVLEYFLSNCRVLERLNVTNAKNLVCLRVVGPSNALKYLAIKYCPHLKCVQICNANIVSFVFWGVWIDLFLSNVPLLVELEIFTDQDIGTIDSTKLALFNQLSCCFSQMEILKLNISGVVYNPNHALPVLAKLKRLELDVETDYPYALYHLSSFITACPYIHTLVLKMDFRRHKEVTVTKAAKCSHHGLKVVEVLGYRDHACAVEHVVYLVENVVALEKIIIDPVRSWIWPPGLDRGTKMVNEEVKAREHARQHLKEKVPSTIELVCL